jgi:hypothetical protein
VGVPDHAALSKPRTIRRQSCDASALGFINHDLIGLTLPVVLFLNFVQSTQFVVPFRFEDIGNQSIRGIDVHVAALRQITVIAGALDLFAAQAVYFLHASLDLLLNGQSHVQGQWGHTLNQYIADEAPFKKQFSDGLLDSCSPRANRPHRFPRKGRQRPKKSSDQIEVRFRNLGEFHSDSNARNSVGNPSNCQCLG